MNPTSLRYMSPTSKPGTRVRFSARGGSREETEEAMQILRIHGIYTVHNIKFKQDQTVVRLKEVMYKQFNILLFEEVDDAQHPNDDS